MYQKQQIVTTIPQIRGKLAVKSLPIVFPKKQARRCFHDKAQRPMVFKTDTLE
jgi:hypothetical protein